MGVCQIAPKCFPHGHITPNALLGGLILPQQYGTGISRSLYGPVPFSHTKFLNVPFPSVSERREDHSHSRSGHPTERNRRSQTGSKATGIVPQLNTTRTQCWKFDQDLIMIRHYREHQGHVQTRVMCSPPLDEPPTNIRDENTTWKNSQPRVNAKREFIYFLS